jgi:hypothetical protein
MSCLPRIHSPAFAMICLAAAALSRAGSWLVAAVDRAVAFVFDVVARPAFAPGGYVDHADTGIRGYVVPPLHSMRHEAGTSRRASARNI